MASRPNRPRLTDYEDFRKFLRDTYAYEKARDPAFSYGAFARKAGLANRGHFKLVADGARGLTDAMVGKFAHGLALGPKEAEYFRLLVALNQAPPSEEAAARTALNAWRTGQRYPQPVSSDALGSEVPLKMLILGMARLKGFQGDPAWIREHLLPAFTEAQIRDALEWLLREGHLVLRGRRCLRGRPLKIFPQRREDSQRLWGPFYRHVADEGFLNPDRKSYLALIPLTEAQMKECGDLLLDWFQANVLHRSQADPGARLCAVLGGLFPMTKA